MLYDSSLAAKYDPNNSERSKAIRKEREKRKAERKADVFPPYNEAPYSDANEIATRWAHREKVKDFAQRIISFDGKYYVIRKDTQTPLMYTVVRKANKHDIEIANRYYKENSKNERDNGLQPGGTGTVQTNAANRKIGFKSKRSDNDRFDTYRYPTETGKTEGMDRIDNHRRRNTDGRGRTVEYGIGDKPDILKLSVGNAAVDGDNTDTTSEKKTRRTVRADTRKATEDRLFNKRELERLSRIKSELEDADELTVEQVASLWGEMRKLQRNVTAMSMAHQITNEELTQVTDLLRGDRTIEDIEKLPADRYNIDGIIAVAKAKLEYENVASQIREYKARLYVSVQMRLFRYTKKRPKSSGVFYIIE